MHMLQASCARFRPPAIIGALLAMASVSSAQAGLVEFCFSGTFDADTSFTVPETTTMVSAGDAFVFAVTFDTDAVNQETTDGLGAFALVASRFEVADLILFGDTGQMNMDARDDGLDDVFVAASTFSSPMFIDVTVLLPDTTFGDPAPPDTLDLPTFPGATLGVSVLEGLFSGTVDTFEVKAVPGPSIIVAYGLFSLGMRRRRRSA